jgi:hypothetical protein
VETFTQRLALHLAHAGLSSAQLAREVGCGTSELAAALRGQPIDAVAFGQIAGWLIAAERRWPQWMRAGAAVPPGDGRVPVGLGAGLPAGRPDALGAVQPAELPMEHSVVGLAERGMKSA